LRNALITGGSGFVGSHLVGELVKRGIPVTVVDDLSNGSIENLQDVLHDITFVKDDISRSGFDLSGNFDAIFHLATHPRSFSLADPYRNLEVNAKGMLNVLELAKKRGSKVIYTSNSGIYGEPKFLPVDESHPDDPKTPYDATKLLGEHLARIYFRIHHVPCVIFRLATVYGERQKVNEKLNWRPVVAEFMRRVLNGETPVIYGDGEQTRDLIYVKDVVKGLTLGAQMDSADGELMILSTGRETSVNQLLETLVKITGIEAKPRHEAPIPGDIRRMVYSFEKAKRLVGYEPSYTLEAGLKRCIKWYRCTR